MNVVVFAMVIFDKTSSVFRVHLSISINYPRHPPCYLLCQIRFSLHPYTGADVSAPYENTYLCFYIPCLDRCGKSVYNIDVEIYDPWVSPEAVRREYGIEVKSSQTQSAQTKSRYDAVILAVAHNEFKTLDYSAITAPRHVTYDVKWLLGVTATDKL